MTSDECETYILWSPTRQTVTAVCTLCGPVAAPREQTDIAGAENDEIEHLWRDLLNQQANKPARADP